MGARFHPKVACANHLLDGHVIYFTPRGWLSQLGHAILAHSPQEAEALLKRASAYPAETVGPHLIDVDLTKDTPQPLHLREVIQTKGPSNYFHGRQAGDV